MSYPYDWTRNDNNEPVSVSVATGQRESLECSHNHPRMFDAAWKWDMRFLNMAMLVASWSKDPSTKCGAVIVRPDRSIAGVGYNGFPRGVPDLDEHLNDRPEKYGRVVHAEVNAILAAKENLRECTLYTWPANRAPSCDRCTAVVIQAGIKRVVHVSTWYTGFADRWAEATARSLDMYQAAGVSVVAYEMEN